MEVAAGAPGTAIGPEGTPLPPWVADPGTPDERHRLDTPLPAALVAGLSALARPARVPLAILLLAVHARVLAALTGEGEVVAGYTPTGDGQPVACRLPVSGGTWREVLAAAIAATAANGAPPGPNRRFATSVDGGRRDGGAAEALSAGLVPDGAGLVLRLDYHASSVDGGYAARLAGYYLAALTSIVDDPGAACDERSLLSAEESRFQLDELRGPDRPVPDRRFHELFEDQVRLRPEAVAAEHAGTTWTYDQLNRRANRLAHALVRHGVRAESPVAVVAGRGLDWLCAVVAVFKAGAAYLPVEPGFPVERIAGMLDRSGCRVAVTEPATVDLLRRVRERCPQVRAVPVNEAAGEYPDENPGVPVAADQLAYVYFTSGSTGEPKGAMCEHAGMLNHLYAKVDDLAIGAGHVVAQTASQCFDISLWQLLSALLVGGRTVIIGQEVLLDTGRFVEEVAATGVNVLQLVPSHLDAVLAYLEQRAAPLPALRYLSVTGEAVRHELVHRWLTRYPGIPMVNAYGLTETSDDTNHEVIREIPADGPVPIGRPVNNVRAYVVDARLRPVPLGAPGELVFSGVCVGRGYVNDPERTAQAFLPDPHRPAARLYRSGDLGRWLPGGRLQFLGRRDTQVKIRGFRIETDEVEVRLARVAGVRTAAVVVGQNAGGEPSLVAFYAADRPLAAQALRERLAESLPAYMVPRQFRWLARLPLTGNGKTDRRALSALARLPQARVGATADRPVRTAAEAALAEAWSEALAVSVSEIGRGDDFFDRGGTSLSAVRLVARLRGRLSLDDVMRRTVFADMAAAMRPATAPAPRPAREAPGTPTPGAAGGPVTLQVPDGTGAAAWVTDRRTAVLDLLHRHGAILVRGLDVVAPETLAAVATRLAGPLIAEREPFTVRDGYGSGVQSSSKWPADQPMCMHHEGSYASQFPGILLFACRQAPAAGGVTGLADAGAILRALPVDLVRRFARDGWLLDRNYNDRVGVPWPVAFGTGDTSAVETYCRANAIEFAWYPGGLRTRQRLPAVVSHPRTGQPCWFNQIAFLNEWTLDPDVREYLSLEFGPDGLPFNTRYGTGEPIGEDVVRTINGVYEGLTVREAWCAGDLLIVDNVRTAHSREPFTGTREILVAMGAPVGLTDCAPTRPPSR